jgi:uncharacterized repeat protein (TIGR01451 family)
MSLPITRNTINRSCLWCGFVLFWDRAREMIVVGIVMLICTCAESVAAQAWPEISFSKPIGGFIHPSHLTSARDGSGRLFVVEQAGRVRIAKNGVLLATPFLDIRTRVGNTSAGTGLVSIAFPPDYVSKGHFYVNYTTASRNLIVARYTVTSNPDIADANSEQIVLTDGPYPGHYGGELAFGPLDGYLYLGIGTGTATMPDSLGQDVTSLHGKLIRIDVETGNPVTYTIPQSNPFRTTPNARPEIWGLGLRNPFRSSFDPETGDFYIADVGQSSREELDFEPADGPGAINYGWNIMEGSECFNAISCNTDGLTFPVAEYDHTEGCSITGGTVYRSNRFPSFQGIYFFGDWCSGRIWGLQRVNGSWQNAILTDSTLSITAFAEDETGNLWIADYRGGAIYPVKEGLPIPVNLSVTQTDSPDPCPGGNRLTYTIRVTNKSAALATGVVLTDTMPAGASFISATINQGTQTRSGNMITWSIPSLASGVTATLTLVVQPTQTGTVTNTAMAQANEPDSDPADNSSSESTRITPGTDLKVTVSDGKTTVAAGQIDIYTIKATNGGPGNVTGATVTDNFPAMLTGVTFTATQSGGASGFTATGTGNIHDTLTMPAGSFVTYKATGKVNSAATGTLANTATIGAPSGVTELTPANNTATDSDTIIFRADLKITATDGKSAAVAGSKNTYTITVTNLGPSNVSGAVIKDNFPSTFTGVTYTATQTGGASGFSATGTGNINDAVTMPSGSKITYKVTGTISISASGSISDTASVNAPSGVTDPNLANNSATDTDTL